MKLSTRLAIAMIALVLFTTAAVSVAIVFAPAPTGTFALASYSPAQAITVQTAIAIIIAIGLALWLARALSKSLSQMTAAVQGFGRDDQLAIPVGASGEVGLIARAFERLAADVRAKTSAYAREAMRRQCAEAKAAHYAEQERFSIAAVASADDAIITKKLDGTITNWNPAAERMFGYTREEAIGRSIDLIVPDHLQTEGRSILEIIGQGETIRSFETVRTTRDGKRIDVEVRISPIKSDAGVTIGASKLVRDITQKRFNEQKFRLAVESCPSGMLMIDSAGKIVLVNGEIERMFGYARGDLIGQTVDMLLPAQLRTRHMALREEFVLRPNSRRMGTGRDLFAVRKNGTEFPVEVGLNPIQTSQGLLILGIVVDISERKLAEEMFRLAVEACPNGMVMVDRSGRIVMVNSETERLFGYERGELIDQPIDILVPEKMRDLHVRHRTGFTAAPETRRMGTNRELFGRRKDGSELAVEVGLNPIPTSDGMLVLSVIVDISERRKNDRLKDEFVSTVSHELRTPLTSIAGSLGLLVGGATGELPEPTMRFLKIAHKNSERLVRLINDILDIEKIESGKVVFDLKRVEMRALVELAIEANRGFAEKFDVRIALDPAATTAFVRADPDRLVQVITNLLSNSIKFSPRGEEVLVDIAQGPRDVRLTVRDHGIGIPEDFKARIFDKFAQADATDTRKKGGTGLGLSIVKQIVTYLGGTVGFDDAPGGGTVFHVDLPRWEITPGAEAAPDDRRARVLICDDDAGVAEILTERLALTGFAADTALSTGAALEQSRARHYDAILVDLKLPDRDGISLIQELRSDPHYQNAPIVVISADAESGRDDMRSASLDVLDWLNKPIDIAHLVAVLERPLARNGAKQPHVLHIDDDADVRGFVAAAVGASCAVTSVASIPDAQAALAKNGFDLVVLDLMLSQTSGLDLLPELRDRDGNAMPVILYSAKAANGHHAEKVRASLNKSHTSIDHVILTLRRHMTARPLPAQQTREVA